MDLMTIQRRNAGLSGRSALGYAVPVTAGMGSADEKADRINDIVKKVTASKPFKNRWGGQDYPVDVTDYGQFLSTLQCLSWVLRDCGYEITYLTKNGLHYAGNEYLSYPNLFDLTQGHIVALVAVGKDERHYRISRDQNTLRIRKFDNITRAIAPMPASGDPSSKPMGQSIAKEIVRVMATQSNLDPTSEQALRRWGRVVQSKSLKPVGAGVLKGMLKLQFRKV